MSDRTLTMSCTIGKDGNRKLYADHEFPDELDVSFWFLRAADLRYARVRTTMELEFENGWAKYCWDNGDAVPDPKSEHLTMTLLSSEWSPKEKA